MSPTQTSALKRKNALTAAIIVAVAAAITASMFAYRFANHLEPMPKTGGYASPYLPAK